GSAQRHRGGPAYAASQTQTLRVLAAACGRAACGRAVEMTVDAKPCGFRTHLGNRFAIATFPPPRRRLDSFNTKSRKELSSAIPSGFLQAHSSIGKDSGKLSQPLRPNLFLSNQILLKLPVGHFVDDDDQALRRIVHLVVPLRHSTTDFGFGLREALGSAQRPKTGSVVL